jgi:UDP-N-acetylglucosamine 2-epimerase
VKASIFSRALAELRDRAPLEEILVHTGQHYDASMSDVFFHELGMPEPKYNLGIGSGVPHKQLSAMLAQLGDVVREERPEAVLVYGDTNSTLAAALASVQADIPLVHVEAGERIYRRRQVPEEVNRILTDNAATLCLTCTRRAERFLRREGIAQERVRFVGDLMYDLFAWAIPRVDQFAAVTPESLGISPEGYALATIHRAQNTASPEVLLSLLETLDSSQIPVLLPVHPRVRDLLSRWKWVPRRSLRLLDPLGYFDFLNLLVQCYVCVTDSGGVTREAYFARRPCIVPMENCWWPEVVEGGWAIETGTSQERILDALANFPRPDTYVEGLFGDGHSASRIIDEVSGVIEKGEVEGAWHRRGMFACIPRNRPTRFTYARYRGMLEELRGGDYRFLSFPEAPAALNERQPFVLMRHDVDFDLRAALRLAEIEAEQGVRATYFFMIRTEHYQLFSREGTAAVRRILDLGHDLGLHFDCAAYPADADSDTLARAASLEAEMLENWFGREVSIVSYHRPSAQVLSGDPAVSTPLPHTYLPLFTERVCYFADSRGQWGTAGEPTESESFARKLPLHILTHPIWWKEQPTAPFEVLLQYADQKQEQLDESIDTNCTVYRARSGSGGR